MTYQRRPRRNPPQTQATVRPAQIVRKPLRDMVPAELQAWLIWHQGELEDFASYAQAWRLRREHDGIHTANDDRYDQFLTMAADLTAGLGELRELAEPTEP